MPEDFELTPLQLDRNSLLKCALSSCALPSFPREKCLLVSFSGTIDKTSHYAGGYPYMHAMIGNGFAACDPAALILDLAELEYESDERMCKLIDQKIVTKLIISDRNRKGITDLVKGILFLDPQRELFETLAEAISACDSTYGEYLRAGRKRIIANDF